MEIKDLEDESWMTIEGDESKTPFFFERVDGEYGRCYIGNALVYLLSTTKINHASPFYASH